MILPSAPFIEYSLPLVAAAAYAWPALRAQHLALQQARLWVLLAWVLHGLLIARGLLSPHAAFGFAPALSMTVWVAVAIYAIERKIYPQLQTHFALYGISAAAVLVAWAFPGTAMMPHAPIGLPLHLALAVLSYGLIGTAVVHAWLMVRAEERIRQAQDPHSGVPLLTLERLTYRFVQAGFVFLTATLIGGWWFSESLYGHAWSWNHKTVLSLLAWLTFAALLLGRKRFGWRGKRATWVLYSGAFLLLLAYVGVRFVVEILLGH